MKATTDGGDAHVNDAGGGGGADRRARLRALVEAHAASAPDELAAAASDPDPLVRSEVAYQVARTRHPHAQAILERLSTDGAPVVRVLVVEGLAALGGAAAQATFLGFAVDDQSEDVRGAAVGALEGIAGPEAERALEQLARDPIPVVRNRAAAALARRREP